MAATLVQWKVAVGSPSATFDNPVTEDNLIVIVGEVQDGTGAPANTGGDETYTGLTTQIGTAYTAHTTFGGQGATFYRYVESGDGQTWGYNNSSGARQVIIAEFSGVSGSAVAATQDDRNNNTTLALTVDPGGTASLVIGGFATRLESTGSFTPNADSTWVGGVLPGQNHDNAILVYSTDSASVAVGGVQGGATRDGYWWGGVAAAFGVDAPAAPEPGVILDPAAADPIDISDYIKSWRITRGASAEITGGASPGHATIVVKNHVDDRFNPDNSSSPLIDYLRDGIGLWIGVNNDGRVSGTAVRGLFGGRTVDITPMPEPGVRYAPLVEITAEDALGWYARTPVRIGYLEGRSHRELRAAILTAAGEDRIDLADEIETMPLSAFDGSAQQGLEEINQGNGTRHFVRPGDSASDWYKYVTYNRMHGLGGSSAASIGTAQHAQTSGWRLSADTVINQQKATVTPISFSPAQLAVWQADTLPLQVTATKSYTAWVDFDDFVNAPTVNSAYSGGTPVITLTPFGDSAKLEITAASGTVTFSALAIEGSLARRWPDQSHIEDDTTSQSGTRGIRAGSDISGEFVGAIASARGIAEHVVWRYATPQRRPTLTVHNWFPQMFDLDLFDVISFTSTELGVSARLFEIVGLTHEGDLAATDAVHHAVTYVLQECRVQSATDWFVADTSTANSTHILGY